MTIDIVVLYTYSQLPSVNCEEPKRNNSRRCVQTVIKEGEKRATWR